MDFLMRPMAVDESMVMPIRFTVLDKMHSWSGEQKLAFAVIGEALHGLNLPHSPSCLNFKGGPPGECDRCSLEVWFKTDSDTIYQLVYLCNLFDINIEVFRRYAWKISQMLAADGLQLNTSAVLRDSVASFIEMAYEE